ncbi:protein kinase, putative [Trypanosoma brucei gambiense DAL972]|uniref:non-specific serine/threonine protein kinase n=1 Tax=Trypanosoma brucei gambiense (strain MHOM/CI/86/DAL972) TaxID=679716 RepID=D0A118_TRYB9|nr:protein kinase, putative [Trypanosoma brucei gambiense DAL972]CBH14960.1 protein kinase, putative [Trypanosoma brucei gambiense DAL972]|eukprot:XP_011777226.1 protein kinase, putative [Trypanosoma brucei gambiense DAL972]
MENYTQLRVLGKGSFGSAWLVQRRSDRVKFVAKEVRLAGLRPAERDSAKREIDLLRTLHHPNITRYVDHFEHRGALYIVMEYADGGDLYSAIRNRRGTRFSEKVILHYFSQLCLAMLHLHEKHILHRDLKTQNVFLTSDGVVKLGDFGISTVLRNTFELRRTVCGTPYYFSPELCLNKPYNNKSDVWALGCILYELTTLTHAFDGNNMKALVQKILKGSYPPIHSSYSTSLSKLISSMLQIDPQRRPSVSEIISSPYIRESLSLLQRVVKDAHNNKGPCQLAGDKERAAAGFKQQEKAQEAPMRAEERRKEEHAKAMHAAKERLQLRMQGEARNRENEEKLRQLKLDQRQAEVEQKIRKQELEARVREQRKLLEQRAKAHALLEKQREEEWERNMREHAEEVRRGQGEEGCARDNRETNAPNDRPCNRYGDGGRRSPLKVPPSPTAAAELYREMRRQAALNKQRFMEEMKVEQPPPAVSGQPNGNGKLPPNRGGNALGNPLGNGQQPQPISPLDDMEARRKAYWDMRREAEENRRRALALEAGPSAVQVEQPEAAPPKESAMPHIVKKPAPQQRPQANDNKPKDVCPLLYAKRTANNEGPPSPQLEPNTPANRVGVYPEVSRADSPDSGTEVKRDEDYNALQTLIDRALTKKGDRESDEDFNDEAFVDSDISRFVLDGRTLVLPKVQATDPLMHRIESLRLFLEGELGESKLLGAYRQMNDISADDDEAMQRVRDELPEAHHKYIPIIAQLIVCEDAFNRQMLR